MAMTVELPALQRTDAATPNASSSRLRRYAGPALGLLLPVGLAVVWEIVVWLGWFSGRLVPPPTKVFATIVELTRNGELSRHIIATLTRVAAGFGLGVAAGTLLGAISGYWGLARQLLDPTVQALRAIPSIAWVPLFILWLGIFETSKVALIAGRLFFPVYLGAMGAVRSAARAERLDARARSRRQNLSQRRSRAGAIFRRDQARRNRRHHRRLRLRKVDTAARHRRPRSRQHGHGDAGRGHDNRAARQDR